MSVQAINRSETTLRPSQLDRFSSELWGELIRPGDSSYEQARHVWNAMIDQHPALIARCANTQDVVACVHFARAHDLLARYAAAATMSLATRPARAAW